MNRHIQYPETFDNEENDLQHFFASLTTTEHMPFTGEDSSVGMEFELQVAVEGNHFPPFVCNR
jgi:hypothetical protein